LCFQGFIPEYHQLCKGGSVQKVGGKEKKYLFCGQKNEY
jgi:hypothetical protein